MPSTNNSTTTNTAAAFDDDDDDNYLIEQFAMLSSPGDGGAAEDGDDDGITRRRSRASINFFQRETSKLASTTPATTQVPAPLKGSKGRRRNSFIGLDGKVQDDYIAKRASLNKPNADNKLTTMTMTMTVDGNNVLPALADLTKAEFITRIDGSVLSQLLISGYARLNSKVDELNRINVFPIADGDTGANMKVCLKLPSRNLLLDPSNSILRVASNMAADVLLNGQGNSGTILSHFYVSLAEEISDMDDPNSLSINEFVQCISNTGMKMVDAVPNPVEGTIISVCRDSCTKLLPDNTTYNNLKEFLVAWNAIAQIELAKTPDQLIVDDIKVLKKAGVVDSGAAGFVYCIEGMYLASINELPEAFNLNIFKTGMKTTTFDNNNDDDLAVLDDHNVCDTKYRFCTEAVIILQDGKTKKDVLAMIDKHNSNNDGDEEPLGDSIACVTGPSKDVIDGGCTRMMCKVHIHTNDPQEFFDKLKPYSCDGIFKKEKVEDMLMMKELEHGTGYCAEKNDNDDDKKHVVDLCDAKFTILGTGCMWLPPPERTSKDIFNLPMFLVPATTGEPIDVRYTTDTDTIIALNQQRNPQTAIKYSTASSSPMQMKIELLAALAKGKPVLVFVFSGSAKMSAFGRNVSQAIDMLDPTQKDMVKMFIHGWNNGEASFILEAMDCARSGKTIDETYVICDEYASRLFGKIGFMSSDLFHKMKAWRPELFPNDFTINDGEYQISGTPVPVLLPRDDDDDGGDDDGDDGGVDGGGCPLEDRLKVSMGHIGMGNSMIDAFQVAAQHIKNGLTGGQKLTNVLIPCVGRPDYGHIFFNILKQTNGIDIIGTPIIYSESLVSSIVMGTWGSVNLMYKIIE